jgi:hypothetical protein
MRNQYLHVKNRKYQLPTVDVLSLLKPNNYTVKAYYLPGTDGLIPEVYIYQDDEFISKCLPVETFNTATAEQTERDREIYTEQAKYVSHFDKTIKEGRKSKTTKLEIIKNSSFIHPEPQIHVPAMEVVQNWDEYIEETDYMQMGKDSI